MKYVPPFGVSDENASYINGDASVGRQGSIPPAAVFENPQREILNVITYSQITPQDTPMPAALRQLAQAVRSQRMNFARDTGSDSNISVAFDPPLTSYTVGLVLHVLIANTNTSDTVRINAGAGSVFVRKMNGAEVGAEQLPAGSLATLIFDGSQFQLSNFGGAGAGAADVFRVTIPYAVDHSPTPGVIQVAFNPPLQLTDPITAGDMIAIKVNNTHPGARALMIEIDGGTGVGVGTTVELLPNGGGGDRALQGDVHKDDIIILLYDGSNFWFTPNPEIDAPVTYTVGTPSSHFLTVQDAIAAIRRKTIGATGFVTLQFPVGVFDGPISVNHPSGDRIEVTGTMSGAPPVAGSFARSGATQNLIDQDAATDIVMLRQRFGTEIRMQNTGGSTVLVGNDYGIANSGPGRVTFSNLLITGNRLPGSPVGGWKQTGVSVGVGMSININNIVVWGAQVGIYFLGPITCTRTIVTACLTGISGGGAHFWAQDSGAFGNQYGWYVENATVSLHLCIAQCNSITGLGAAMGSSVVLYHGHFDRNAIMDVSATSQTSISLIRQTSIGAGVYINVSPAPFVVGNWNSIIVGHDTPRSRPPLLW